MWVDGDLVSTTKIERDIDWTTDAMGAFFGSCGGFWGFWLDGKIDYVSIFDSSLSPLEIQSYLGTQLSGNEPNLKGLWNFNKGSGDKISDQSLNSNEGTINGSIWSKDSPKLIRYTPIANYNGTDSFTFSASDGAATSNIARVSITINPIQDPPSAFEWVSTPLDTINITQSNLSDTYTLQWSESIDVDGPINNISQDTVMAFHNAHISGGYRDNFFGISDPVYLLNESSFKKDEKISIKSQSMGVTGHFQIDYVTGVMENSGIRYLYIQTSTWSGCDTCPKSISDELGDNTRLGDTWTLYKGNYLNYQVFAQIGVNPPEEVSDTTSTSVPITYQELLENVFEPFPMLPRVTVRFSVNVTDGIDTVEVTGDDRVIFVNRYDYLSTVDNGIPTEFALHENYPNPFNPTTTLRFDLPDISDVTLTIYNMLGQKVKTFNMQSTPAGYHSITWDATNDLNQQVGAGVYLYQLQTKDFVKTRKMVLLK
jgi:hypothetical protein